MDQQLTAPAHPAGKLILTKDAARILSKHPKSLERSRKNKRGPRWYQPEGPGSTVYYLEHEVIAYALGKRGER